MKKELIVEILLGIVLIALVITIYLGYFHFSSCDSEDCFSKAIVECKRVSYLLDSPYSLMKYKVLGPSSEGCNIEVSLLQIKKGEIALLELEGAKMTCSIPLGSFVKPESNLENCKGELKEEIQGIVISRMHSELASNIGKINQSFSNITRVV